MAVIIKFMLILRLLLILNCASEWNRKTSSSDLNKGSIFALANQNISCEKNEALAGFQFLIEGEKIHYEFKCNSNFIIVEPVELTTLYTEWDKIGYDEHFSTAYLDRHNINCDYLESVINGFQLEKNESKIRIRYTCIKINLKKAGAYGRYNEFSKSSNVGSGELNLLMDTIVNEHYPGYYISFLANLNLISSSSFSDTVSIRYSVIGYFVEKKKFFGS